jgi:hypothetical protein
MPYRDDLLDRRLFNLSDFDPWTTRDACEGTLIMSSSGGGKTTTVGKNTAHSFLRTPMMAGVVLVAKGEETQNWIDYAQQCGCPERLVVFNESSGHCFDPLAYEWSRPGRGSGDVENLIELFTTLQSLGKQHIGLNNDRFWEQQAEKIERHSIKGLDIAGEPVAIDRINQLIESLPTRPGECEEEAWEKESYCARVLASIRDRQDRLSSEQWSDLEVLTRFLLKKWPAMDDRPRSSIEATWSGMADKFLFHPFARLFCGGRCSFTPEQIMREGKVLVVDFPYLQYAETGRFINVMLKLIFQRAWLRRDIREYPHPNFLWMDEFQYFVTRRDNAFQQTCRSSRVAVVCLTQNILNLAEELGEQQPGSKTKAFLANLGTKFFLQQNCYDTCLYAADQIGREYRYLDSFHAGSSDAGRGNVGVGGSQQLLHIVEPAEFTRLKRPDGQNPYAEAIVYKNGHIFNATITDRNPKGRNYLRVLFSREI